MCPSTSLGQTALHTSFNNNPKTFLPMAYKIIDIEGVGEVYAEKLIAAGITKVEELLEKCAAPAGRKALAEQTGISEKLILKWTNHADLFRINGVGPQFAELLEAAGVDTVKELKHRVAENLQKKLEEVNAQKNLCNRVPAVAEVQKMIDQAKELPATMTY
jgi:predicted flap endonuclease-1-like 5' DNA nuclease